MKLKIKIRKAKPATFTCDSKDLRSKLSSTLVALAISNVITTVQITTTKGEVLKEAFFNPERESWAEIAERLINSLKP